MKPVAPSVSIVIPTFNSAWVLRDCLERIRAQDYPRGKVEILVADGGSTDGTVALARSLGVRKIYENPLRTGEAGKAVCIPKARNEVIALIDSDNLLPHTGWLKAMVEPFSDPEIFASEPWEYTYRREDGFITRYCALLGMNDPLCLFLGNYDRRCVLTGKWTGLDVQVEDRGSYLKAALTAQAIPTVGANGFLIRRKDLLKTQFAPYLFDIDCVYDLVKTGRRHVAKVKTGVIHLYARDLSDFARKQRRRVRDFLYYRQNAQRRYPWGNFSKLRLAWFVAASLLIFPTLWQAIRGFIRRPDPCWFFHPVACFATLWVYGTGFLRGRILNRAAILDRKGWR